MITHLVAEPLDAVVTVSVTRTELAKALTASISRALGEALLSCRLSSDLRVVRLRTRKRLARLRPERIAGAIAIVRVTATNARHLIELVDELREAGVAAVQLVWDGKMPEREKAEPHVFAVLERARATPSGPPVVVAKETEPAFALTLLVAHRTSSVGRNNRQDEAG